MSNVSESFEQTQNVHDTDLKKTLNLKKPKNWKQSFANEILWGFYKVFP